MIRKSRRVGGLILGLLIATVPMAVIASDYFTDIPNDHTFHDQISAIRGAGITQGDTATTYAPLKEVNRQQMAAFLNRGLGRVAYSGNGAEVALTDDGATQDTVNTVAITPGNAIAPSTAMVKADASFTVGCVTDGDADGICTVLVSITDGTGTSRVATLNVNVGENENGSLTWATEVDVTTAGTATTLTLQAVGSAGGDASVAAGEVTALYVPFGADGGNTLAPTP